MQSGNTKTKKELKKQKHNRTSNICGTISMHNKYVTGIPKGKERMKQKKYLQ